MLRDTYPRLRHSFLSLRRAPYPDNHTCPPGNLNFCRYSLERLAPKLYYSSQTMSWIINRLSLNLCHQNKPATVREAHALNMMHVTACNGRSSPYVDSSQYHGLYDVDQGNLHAKKIFKKYSENCDTSQTILAHTLVSVSIDSVPPLTIRLNNTEVYYKIFCLIFDAPKATSLYTSATNWKPEIL